MIVFPRYLGHLPKSKSITLPPSTIKSSPSPLSKVPTPPLATATSLSPCPHLRNFNPANPSISPICLPRTNAFLDRSLSAAHTPCCELLPPVIVPEPAAPAPASLGALPVLLLCPSPATNALCSKSSSPGTPYIHTLFPPKPTATISPSTLGEGSTVGPTDFPSFGPAKYVCPFLKSSTLTALNVSKCLSNVNAQVFSSSSW